MKTKVIDGQCWIPGLTLVALVALLGMQVNALAQATPKPERVEVLEIQNRRLRQKEIAYQYNMLQRQMQDLVAENQKQDTEIQKFTTDLFTKYKVDKAKFNFDWDKGEFVAAPEPLKKEEKK